jgi:diaminohydroxyphosphoribosylaminopyrimidine deaminase/5-amino-6-(5-phosphoribosylamino)uracil reductase
MAGRHRFTLVKLAPMPRKKSNDQAISRPSVTMKFAQSLDGRIATASGDSKWISSEASLRFAHKLRAEHDAILVGVGTVLTDDPQLNVRMVKGQDPMRVIVDSRLRIPPNSRVIRETGPGKTLIATTKHAPRARVHRFERLGAEVVVLGAESDHGRVDLRELLGELARRGIRSVLVEGGSEVITSLLRAGLVDRFVVVIAPKLIGRGVESVGDLDIRRLQDAVGFATFKIRRLGPDLVFDGQLASRISSKSQK